MSGKTIPFIGLGTGRCGTNSLVHILNACKNVEVTKSAYPVPWYGPASEDLMSHLEFNGYSKGKVIGDVSEYLLPHVGMIRRRHPKLKVVCLHRPMKETVDSMMKWVKRYHRPHDQLVNRNNKLVQFYPVIDAATERQAFEFFWQFYEEESRAIDGAVMHVHTLELNNRDVLEQMFDFLSIPKEDQEFAKERNIDPFKVEAMAAQNG